MTRIADDRMASTANHDMKDASKVLVDKSRKRLDDTAEMALKIVKPLPRRAAPSRCRIPSVRSFIVALL